MVICSISNIEKFVYGTGKDSILMYFNGLLLFCKYQINHSPNLAINGKAI